MFLFIGKYIFLYNEYIRRRFTMSEIKFWKSTDEYGFLSNFYVFPIKINNKKYKTIEHWFQSQKFVGTKYEEHVRKQPTAHLSSKEGKRRDLPLRKDWEDIKEEIMLIGLREKFKYNKMKQLLLNTGESELIEDSPYDYYWGIGKDGTGKNRLGILLMQVRKELKNN